MDNSSRLALIAFQAFELDHDVKSSQDASGAAFLFSDLVRYGSGGHLSSLASLSSGHNEDRVAAAGGDGPRNVGGFEISLEKSMDKGWYYLLVRRQDPKGPDMPEIMVLTPKHGVAIKLPLHSKGTEMASAVLHDQDRCYDLFLDQATRIYFL